VPAYASCLSDKEALVLLLGSRYCKADRLSEIVWSLFRENAARLRPRPGHLQLRSPAHRLRLRTRTRQQDGTGSLLRSHRRLPGLYAPRGRVVSLHDHPGAILHWLSRLHRRAGYGRADGFAAWFEAYLGGEWYAFDARNNIPRIGWVLIARGRDGGGRRDQQEFWPERA
jgi:hypothetical protein